MKNRYQIMKMLMLMLMLRERVLMINLLRVLRIVLLH